MLSLYFNFWGHPEIYVIAGNGISGASTLRIMRLSNTHAHLADMWGHIGCNGNPAA